MYGTATVAENSNTLAVAEQQYLEAVAIHDNPKSSAKDYKTAAGLLFEAAGIERIVKIPTGNKDHTATSYEIIYRANATKHEDAIWYLGQLYRGGLNVGIAYNPAVAERLVIDLAEFGNAQAQAHIASHKLLGVVPLAPSHSSGVPFKLIPPEVPTALVQLFTAARFGNPTAQTILGYRHLYGLGVPKSCSTAVNYYASAAEAAIEASRIENGLPKTKQWRLNHRTAHARPKQTAEQEVLHYQWFADFGNLEAARTVAYLLSHGAMRDAGQAVRYLEVAAAAGDPVAMAHLGHAFANGLGVERSRESAAKWFKRASEHRNPSALFSMGYLHMTGDDGIGGVVDYKKALRYYKESVNEGAGRNWTGQSDAFFFIGKLKMYDRGRNRNCAKCCCARVVKGPDLKSVGETRAGSNPVGSVLSIFLFFSFARHFHQLFCAGMMHLNGWGTHQDVSQAITYFTLSTNSGHLLAAYNLAMLHLGGRTNEKNPCQTSASLLKKVAERQFFYVQEGHDDFEAGDYDWALFNYLHAAELGIEMAQTNGAYMLTEGYFQNSIDREATNISETVGLHERDEVAVRALYLHQRAAEQGNVAALIRLGDAHWFGKGAPVDWNVAVAAYAEAGKQQSAQGLFNMGLAHALGTGAVIDSHLAKRFFDRTLEVEPDAALAVELALLHLKLQDWWSQIEPKLPAKWAAILRNMSQSIRKTGERFYYSSIGSRHSVMPRSRGVSFRGVLNTAIGAFDDMADASFLFILALLLMLVLWRRRLVRLRRVQGFEQ